MLIGIDGNEANVERRVGVGEYNFELLKQFEKFNTSTSLSASVQSSTLRLRSVQAFKVYLKESPRRELPKQSESWAYRVIGPRPLWTQVALPLDLYFHHPRPDVFFTPTHYAPRFSPVPTVISIMDVSYIHFPEMFRRQDLYKLQKWTKHSARRASVIFTISKASRDDIIKTYGVPGERVVVTYPGIKRKGESVKGKATMESAKIVREKFNIGGDYILFVGTLQPRKNIARLIEAFSYVILERSDRISSGKGDPIVPLRRDSRMTTGLQLVIVGKKGWQYEEILSAPKKYGVEERVRFLDFVSDQDLGVLYQNARCFVLPSLYEGFGLPVLEAMQYGCPVVTSNVSSLPEAGGDAALYVDPYNVDDIAKNVAIIIQNTELRESLIKKGYEQVKKFSWEKTAKETLAVLEEITRK